MERTKKFCAMIRHQYDVSIYYSNCMEVFHIEPLTKDVALDIAYLTPTASTINDLPVRATEKPNRAAFRPLQRPLIRRLKTSCS